jgi:mRNA interferase RelE/StbE
LEFDRKRAAGLGRGKEINAPLDVIWKDLRRISKNDLKKILSRIEKIADDPRRMGCEKLTGEDFYRVRKGNYRIVYSIQDNELAVWAINVRI